MPITTQADRLEKRLEGRSFAWEMALACWSLGSRCAADALRAFRVWGVAGMAAGIGFELFMDKTQHWQQKRSIIYADHCTGLKVEAVLAPKKFSLRSS